MKLYHDPISGNCYKVRLLLAQLGLPCDEVAVSVRGERPKELLALSPSGGRVPLLVLDDGSPLAESGAILWHLGRGTRFIPQDDVEQSRMLAWMFFEQNLHEPFIATRRFWVAYAQDPSPRADQLPFWLERGNQALATMDQWLERHPFFGGDDFSLADIALYAYTHVAGEGGFDLSAYPAVGAWLARVSSLPGHVEMND